MVEVGRADAATVAFKLADTAKLPALSEGMLALKEQCVREDGSRYIVSAVGGKQSNTEGHDGGMQVVFLVEFEVSEGKLVYEPQGQTEHDPRRGIPCLQLVWFPRPRSSPLTQAQNQEDADYYINHDSAHTAFKDKLGSMDLEGVTVLDFTPGAF